MKRMFSKNEIQRMSTKLYQHYFDLGGEGFVLIDNNPNPFTYDELFLRYARRVSMKLLDENQEVVYMQHYGGDETPYDILTINLDDEDTMVQNVVSGEIDTFEYTDCRPL